FAVDNEKSEINVSIDGAGSTVKNNPDGSLSIDGTVFTDRKAAAKAFVGKPAMKKLTPEAWGAADAVTYDPPATSKDLDAPAAPNASGVSFFIAGLPTNAYAAAF